MFSAVRVGSAVHLLYIKQFGAACNIPNILFRLKLFNNAVSVIFCIEYCMKFLDNYFE
jgi:hypothetical protein